MSLAAADKAIVERWAGTLRSSADEAAAEERIQRLGNAHMAALEILLIDRADMSRNAGSVKSGDDWVDHTRNLEWIEAQIAKLSAWIVAHDLSTNDDMLDEATGTAAQPPTTFALTARNTRRG